MEKKTDTRKRSSEPKAKHPYAPPKVIDLGCTEIAEGGQCSAGTGPHPCSIGASPGIACAAGNSA